MLEEQLPAAQIVRQTKELLKEQGQVKIPVLGVSFHEFHDASLPNSFTTTSTDQTKLSENYHGAITNSIISFMERSH